MNFDNAEDLADEYEISHKITRASQEEDKLHKKLKNYRLLFKMGHKY